MPKPKLLTKEEVPEEYHDRILWDTQNLALSTSGKRYLEVYVKCEKCSEPQEITVNTVRNWCRGIRKGPFPGTHRKCRFSGETIDAEGYVRVYVGYDFERDRSMYRLKHRVVMEEILGRPLAEKETVHHIDGDKKNNEPSNLQLRTGRHGKGVRHACGDCGSDNIVAVAL